MVMCTNGQLKQQDNGSLTMVTKTVSRTLKVSKHIHIDIQLITVVIVNQHINSITIYQIDHDITGDVLLDLTHDTLKDMGMTSTGRRIRLLKMIAELRLHVADLTIQETTDESKALEGLSIN